jgi:hypothetical protein
MARANPEPILILNPRKRRRMPAGLARYWAHRRRNPHRRHYHRARRVNHRRHHHRAHRRNPRRHHYRHHRRRNPSGLGGAGRDIFGDYLVPGTIGALGAIGFDVLWGYVEPQLPASFQNGWVATIAELVTLWFAVKAADSMAPKYRQTIHRAGLGAATVIAYNALEGVAAQYLPAGTPGLSGYIPSSRFALGRMVGPGMMGNRMAGYMPRQFSGLGDLGYLSPAAVVQAGPPQQFGEVADMSMVDDPDMWGHE